MVYVEREGGCAPAAARRPVPRWVRWALLQPLADVIKLMFKEELRPKAADAILFALAPIISATARVRRLRGRALRRRDDGLSACWTSRSDCRSPT